MVWSYSGFIVEKDAKVVDNPKKMWRNKSEYGIKINAHHIKGGHYNMQRISIKKAMDTAISCYIAGEQMTKAIKVSFGARSVLNDMIDRGLTDEEIKRIWDEAERRQVLREAAKRS